MEENENIDLKTLILESIVKNYFPQQKIYPISVVGFEILCKDSLNKSLEDLGEELKNNLLMRRHLYRFKATEPKVYGDVLVFSLLRDATRKENLLENGGDAFVKVRKVPLRVVPSESMANFWIFADKTSVKVYVMGGKEDFQETVIRHSKSLIVKSVDCKGHRIVEYTFGGRGMYVILDKIIENVAYLVIDPKHNEKFAKVMSKGGRKPRLEDIEYLVNFIKIRGFKITKSPGIVQLLEEEKILIDEIIGQWKYDHKNKVTIWVRRDGRVTFYIPSKIAVDEDLAKEKAIEFYSELINISQQESRKPEVSETTLETFFEDIQGGEEYGKS